MQRFLIYLFLQMLYMFQATFQETLHLTGCNLESYYDARTYEYQILKMLLVLAFASIRKKQLTLIFTLSATFQEIH